MSSGVHGRMIRATSSPAASRQASTGCLSSSSGICRWTPRSLLGALLSCFACPRAPSIWQPSSHRVKAVDAWPVMLRRRAPEQRWLQSLERYARTRNGTVSSWGGIRSKRGRSVRVGVRIEEARSQIPGWNRAGVEGRRSSLHAGRSSDASRTGDEQRMGVFAEDR